MSQNVYTRSIPQLHYSVHNGTLLSVAAGTQSLSPRATRLHPRVHASLNFGIHRGVTGLSITATFLLPPLCCNKECSYLEDWIWMHNVNVISMKSFNLIHKIFRPHYVIIPCFDCPCGFCCSLGQNRWRSFGSYSITLTIVFISRYSLTIQYPWKKAPNGDNKNQAHIKVISFKATRSRDTLLWGKFHIYLKPLWPAYYSRHTEWKWMKKRDVITREC